MRAGDDAEIDNRIRYLVAALRLLNILSVDGGAEMLCMWADKHSF